MPLINTSLPNLIQGVSQQPDSVRFDGQCEEQENALSSVVNGLVKRPPSELVGKLLDVEDETDSEILDNAFIHFVQRTDDERYVVMLDGFNLRVFRAEPSGGSMVQATINVNGGSYSTGYPVGLSDYLYSTTSHQNVKALTIGDTTTLVNTAKAVNTSTEATDGYEDKAIVFVKQLDYSKDYKVTTNIGTVTASTGDNTSSANAKSGALIDTLVTGLSGQAGISAVKIDDAHLEVVGFTSISVSDDLYGDGLGLVYKEVPAISDLPVVGSKDLVIKVRGDTELNQDDYYVKFETTDNNSIGRGGWVETVAPDITFQFGENMPVQLVNTGENSFELRGLPANIRGAGDNNSNPFPSFTGNSISNIFLFKNRLGVLSNDAVTFSESGLGGSVNATAYYVNGSDTAGSGAGYYYPLYLEPSVIYGDYQSITFSDTGLSGKTFYMPTSNLNKAQVGAPSGYTQLTDVNSYAVTTEAQGFNFFRTSVTTLLDSDRIDVSVSNRDVTKLRAAQPFQENLLLFSDDAQFVLKGGDLLTPKTVSITQVTNFDYKSTVEPLPLGSYLYFPFERGSFSGLREYAVNPTTDVYDSIEVSRHVPNYIEKDLLSMTGSDSEGIIAMTTGEVGETAQTSTGTGSVVETIQGTGHSYYAGDSLIYHTTTYDVLNPMTTSETFTFTDEGGGSFSRTSYDRFPNLVTNYPTIKGYPASYFDSSTAMEGVYGSMSSTNAAAIGWPSGEPDIYRQTGGIYISELDNASDDTGWSTLHTQMNSTDAYTIEMLFSQNIFSSSGAPIALNKIEFRSGELDNDSLFSVGYYSAHPGDAYAQNQKPYINIGGTEYRSALDLPMKTAGLYHLVVTGNGSNTRLYVNNTLYLEVNSSYNPFKDIGFKHLMFSRDYSANFGLIYSRIYNKRLSANQIQSNYLGRFN